VTLVTQARATIKEAKDASADERPKTPTTPDRLDLSHPNN